MQSGKAQVQEVRGHVAKDKNFQHMNKLSWISPNQVLQSRLIYTGCHKLVKNNRGKGRGVGLKKRGGLLTLFPWKGWGTY